MKHNLNLLLNNNRIEEIIKEIIKILKRHIKQPFRVYLFGSFARNEATKFSDIDLALETERSIPRVYLIKIKKDLENLRTLRKIDLIYLNTASKNLKDVVKKEGVLIYEFRG